MRNPLGLLRYSPCILPKVVPTTVILVVIFGAGVTTLLAHDEPDRSDSELPIEVTEELAEIRRLLNSKDSWEGLDRLR